MLPRTTKRCTRCAIDKSVSAFHPVRRDGRKDSLRPKCKSCERQMKRSYRAAHLDRVRAYKTLYRNAHLEQERARDRKRSPARNRRAWTAEDSARHRQWYIDNLAREREKTRQRKAADPDKTRAQTLRYKPKQQEWAKANPAKVLANGRKSSMTRRARTRQIFVEYVDPAVVFSRDGGMCGICHVSVTVGDKWHVDHIVPIAKGGLHAYANVQLAHAMCNIKKGARLIAA